MKLEVYNVDTTSGVFTKVDEITTFRSLTFSDKLNGVGGAYFTLSPYDEASSKSNLKRWRSIIAVKDNDTYLWVGPVVNTRLDNFGDIDGNITVECVSYIGMLKDRYTDQVKNYSSTDAGEIAWDLINETQSRTNGHLGLTKGTIEVTTRRDRTYEYKNVLEAIKDLTKVNGGFDFDLTYTQTADGDLDKIKFNVYSDKGQTRNYEFKLGYNVQNISVSTVGDIVNYVTYIGAGTGDDIITVTAEDATSQKGYTRREDVIARKDISIEDTLTEHAYEIVRKNKVDNYEIMVVTNNEIEPKFGNIELGDKVKLNLHLGNGYIDFDGYGTAKEYEVTVGKEGEKKVMYKLSCSN